MKTTIEKILLGLLWLLATSLASSFWLNTWYGFNPFLASHWEYLATLQASQEPIKSGFYISLVLFITITLVGLYWIIKPKFKQIHISTLKKDKQPQQKNEIESFVPVQPQPPYPDTTSTENNKDESQLPNNTHTEPSVNISRPPRPFITVPQQHNTIQPQIKTNILAQQLPTGPSVELTNIFKNAGYIIHNFKKIGSLKMPVVAVSHDQHILIGAENISAAEMQDAIETLLTIFDSTLGEAVNDLTITGYIVAPTEKTDSNFNILFFDTADEMTKQLSKNPPLDTDDDGLFESFNSYISTVAKYIGNT